MLTSGSVMGNLLGFSMGSFLYGIGGFICPFIVNSSMILMQIPNFIYLIKKKISFHFFTNQQIK